MIQLTLIRCESQGMTFKYIESDRKNRKILVIKQGDKEKLCVVLW